MGVQENLECQCTHWPSSASALAIAQRFIICKNLECIISGTRANLDLHINRSDESRDFFLRFVATLVRRRCSA